MVQQPRRDVHVTPQAAHHQGRASHHVLGMDKARVFLQQEGQSLKVLVARGFVDGYCSRELVGGDGHRDGDEVGGTLVRSMHHISHGRGDSRGGDEDRACQELMGLD